MKGFMVACALFSGLANAQSLQINVKNFNFTYANPYGEGSATSFHRSFIEDAVDVKVEKVQKDFLLSTTGAENHEFIFKDAPGFLIDAETMNVKGFNLDLSNTLSLTLASGRFLSQKDNLKLDGLNLGCDRDISHTEDMDQLISGCVNKMTFKASKFSMESAKASISNILSEALQVYGEDKADVGVNSLDLRTQNGKYSLEADVKAQVSGKVKSKGNMSYDAHKGTITIKISEVKFGFFNITGKVFDELKKNESEQLKVKEPYVYYTLK